MTTVAVRKVLAVAAAIESVKRTTFYPATINGSPTTAWMTVAVDFKFRP